jgi:hypothetical protein
MELNKNYGFENVSVDVEKLLFNYAYNFTLYTFK